jgi:hypothetical protein
MVGLLPRLMGCAGLGAMTVAATAAMIRVAVLPVGKSNWRCCRRLCNVRRPLREEGGKAAGDCGPSVATYEEVNSFVVPLVRLESVELHKNSCFRDVTR